MNKFRIINNITGWLTFIVAVVVYLMTIEPTASFWDCGEFISTAFKLEVGHPPGAPLFMIIGRFFTLFAGNNTELVPVMINAMSAIMSALTILFLFWTITHYARKIVIKTDADFTAGNLIAIVGSGLVGALAYTFSDTFWFSAVEGEVYASSSFFTAIVFWAILKWEDVADKEFSNRWLIFIAYLMGLSIGVHLLNLLAIPAIVFVYYYKNYTVTRKGLIITSILSVVILALIMYGIIQGLVLIAGYVELLFVNGFGLPFNTGVLFYVLLVLGLIVWGLYYTYTKKQAIWNTILLGVTVIILGYSSVAMIVIRSNANTPLDENNPDDMFALQAYLNREQYGDRPLISGPVFNAPVTGYEEGKPVYTPIGDKYEITNRKISYKYDERFMMFFPRMYSPEADHVRAYKEWANIKGTPIQTTNNKGEAETIYRPTFFENMKFFFSYQIGHMYIRYFMWNFAGRQNDIQGHGDITKGNWISGINFIDEMRLGPQKNLPDYLDKNKAKNKLYFLPLILGLIGFYFQLSKNKRDFTIVSLLFILTGFAILVYLNQTPYQPRERDYAYAGSFYAFTIWIGLGVLSLIDALKKKVPHAAVSSIVTIACLLAVPGLMASQNWDDHDRSNRYTARDFASNYLNSCEPNAIIFTNGDNDTFPLWYVQEVEGVRLDIRVVNLSYLGADWYIEQMQQKMYESEKLPFSMNIEKYRQGNRDVIYLVDRIKEPIDLGDAMRFLASDNPETKSIQSTSEKVDYLPSKKFSIKVDSAQVLKNGIVPKEKASKIANTMQWSINRNYITKSDMMVLDLLANNDWKRPIYFAITVSRENYLNLESYFELHGLAYKIVPILSPAIQGEVTGIDTKILYDNMINKFKWGGINNPKVYLDDNNLRMASNFRNNFAKLAEALITEGKKDSALTVLDKCIEVMPNSTIPYNYYSLPIADNYYRLNKPEKANEIIKIVNQIVEKELNYYLKLPAKYGKTLDFEKRLNFHIMQECARLTETFGQTELSKGIQERLQTLAMLYTPNE